MPCLFCESCSHLSQYCNIYISDEARVDRIEAKNLCEMCLKSVNEHDTFSCEEKEENCFICFSEGHLSIFCPDRFTAPQLFLPNTDKILFRRLYQMFKPTEQYSLAFSSKEASHTFTVKPLKIIAKAYITDLRKCSNSNILVKKPFKVCHLQNVCPKINVIEAEKIIISSSDISLSEFFTLLSPNLKFLKCINLTLTPTTILLPEILVKFPNLEEVKLYQSNIIVGGTWNYSKIKYFNKTKVFEITTTEIFDLNDIMQTFEIWKISVQIHLRIRIPMDYLCQMIKQNFVEIYEINGKRQILHVSVERKGPRISCHPDFRHFGYFQPI